MPLLIEAPPYTHVDCVTEVLHGVPVADPYRWLEDQPSALTRDWIAAQALYARSYLDSIAGRQEIQRRVRELVDVETYDSLQKIGERYFFRKRLPGQEQPCICFREGPGGRDEVIIDPAQRAEGAYVAVRLLQVSPDGSLLLYEVKHGGERSGAFELFDLHARKVLRDKLPHGYLRGFAFSPDSQSFYYVHEPLNSRTPVQHSVFRHVLGCDFAQDVEVFSAGEGDGLRLHIVPGVQKLGLLVSRFSTEHSTDFYLLRFDSQGAPVSLIQNARCSVSPLLLNDGRILAITDHLAPNFCIVEIQRDGTSEPNFRDIVPESGSPIQNWCVAKDKVFVSYFRNLRSEIQIFDLSGQRLGEIPIEDGVTMRLVDSAQAGDEVFLERESFTSPVQICEYSISKNRTSTWAERRIPFASQGFQQTRVWVRSKDGTEIPMSLVGSPDVLDNGCHPTILTAYGGYGVPVTPQFSVFVAFLLERGCLFALPHIRGGGEFGADWYNAAKGRNRQVAFDDFIAVAEWLIQTGRTQASQLAIFGGSNSGLLAACALTQRPELFRAVVCIAPILDMVRYHLFDDAQLWQHEFGTSADPEDLAALLKYSPYHNVKEKAAYPATLIVSGDCDQKCNPLHARKMTARLQAANVSEYPILLDYKPQRGHSPVLPLTDRVEALTDRLAFLCDQLNLSA